MPTAPIRRDTQKPSKKQNPTHRIKQAEGLDPYYSSLSNVFRFMRTVTLLILIGFMLFSLTFLRRDITLENLKYLLSFANATNTETSISVEKIDYASGSPNRMELLLGDLCTLTPSGYALYDSRGNQIMAETMAFKSPVLKVGSKTALCYDLDGNSFAVINTFTTLYEETYEYPITDGDIADNGSFAVASSSRDYHTYITLYSSSFKPKVRIKRRDRLTALEYKDDASELAVMTAGVRDGEFYTTVELIEPGSDKVRITYELPALGYSLHYTDSGIITVSDESICFFDKDMKLTAEVIHPTTLARTHSNGKYFVALYSDGVITNSYTAVIFDSSANEVYRGSFSGKPVAIDSDSSGDYIFIHNGTTVSRINTVNKKIGTVTVKADAIDLLVSEPTVILAAYENYALTYKLDSGFTEHYYDGTPEDPEPSESTQQ